MNDDFDDLDRALFALPLEMPPAGLRESIMRATVFAATDSPLAFSRYEIAGIGTALALAAWLVIVAVTSHAFAAEFAANVYAVARVLGQPMTLAWLAAGGAVAMLATFTSLPLPRLPVRSIRS